MQGFDIELSSVKQSKLKLLFQHSTFPGGEEHVKFLNLPEDSVRSSAYKFATIRADIVNSRGLIVLGLLRSALLEAFGADLRVALHMPYLPYARQDRVCSPGEAFSLKFLANYLNSLEFHSIQVFDVHSKVAEQLIPNLVSIDARKLFNPVAMGLANVVIVAPDKGAIERANEISFLYDLPIIVADKVRIAHPSGLGSSVVIELPPIPDELRDKDFLIVDDICDGGRTFLELANKLRPFISGKIYLYVTNGIFSNGLNVFNGVIDRIYTAHTFPNEKIVNAKDVKSSSLDLLVDLDLPY